MEIQINSGPSRFVNICYYWATLDTCQTMEYVNVSAESAN